MGATSKEPRTGRGPRPSPMTGGMLLGGAASAEAVVRAAVSDWPLPNILMFWLLGLAGTLPLALLGPAPAAALVVAATVLSLVGFHSLTVAVLCAALMAFHGLGRTGPRHVAALLLAPAAAVTFLVVTLLNHTERWVEIPAAVLASLTPLAAWAGADQRARLDAEQHGAARQAILGRLMEHTARGERARIARELHDVVAHHISVVAVQAETARLTTPGMPEAGAQRLTEIGDGARAALTEMRRLLGVLREDTPSAEPEVRHPQPRLRQLTDLVDDIRTAGGAGIRLIMRGTPVPLPSGVELAAYRIVQEALTNARRHAPGAAVDVELTYTEAALVLRIRDNGPGPPLTPADAGHGLLGMRERAAAVGGRLATGQAPGVGFLIEASLPSPRVERSALHTQDSENIGMRGMR